MKTTIKTNSKLFNDQIFKYILDCINSEEIELKNDKDKIAFLSVQFDCEYNNTYNKKRYPNLQNRLSNWFMGLPSSFNIDFANYRILEIAKDFNSLPQDASEKQENDVLNNWFNLVAFKVLQLAKKNNINF